MTKSFNIYFLSRIGDEGAFDRVKTHACGESEAKRTPRHEILSIRDLVDGLLKNGVSVDALDGFFSGYQIPRIGKEFDLLKFANGEILNIEIKSRAVSKKEILSQLLKNRHYLSHLGRKTEFYTVITDTLTAYKLTDSGTLDGVKFSAVADAVKRFDGEWEENIDNLFRARDYLVSPLNTPEKFIRGEYFLTQAQDFTKKKILSDIELHSRGYYSLLGTPGTGKTLLLYDVAKTLAKNAQTLVIHAGRNFGGEETLNREIENFKVITLNSLNQDELENAKNVFVDESHRLSAEQFEMIKLTAKHLSQTVFFSCDPEQILNETQRKTAIHKKIAALPLAGRYKLFEKMRANRELEKFIMAVRDLRLKPKYPTKYENVTVLYAKDQSEAEKILRYFKDNGYVFISYSNAFKNRDDFDANSVAGEEFDNVIMMLDNTFFYDKSGRLKGVPRDRDNLIYPNLFYQGITRVREKLALIVVGNEKLFNRISTVFDYKRSVKK